MTEKVTILDPQYGVSHELREELMRAAGSAASWEVASGTVKPGAFPKRVLAARAAVKRLEEQLAALPETNEENDPRLAALIELRTNPRTLRAAVTGVELRPRRGDELPRVALGANRDEPRVATLCSTYLRAVQGNEPLLLREVWQIPGYLRFAILEGLLEAAKDAIEDRIQDRNTEAEDSDTEAGSAILTLFASLRVSANMDWMSILEPLI